MSEFRMKLPDVGEGVAEAELVEWLVAVGDEVTPDSVLAEVLTDKATVEVSSPVTGRVTELCGDPGDVLAVGSDLIAIETTDAAKAEAEAEADDGPDEPEGASATDDGTDDDGADDEDEPDRKGSAEPDTDTETETETETETDDDPDRGGTADTGRAEQDDGAGRASVDGAEGRSGSSGSRRRAMAAPAVRARADALGVDLAAVDGTGPDGRVTHADLDRHRTTGRRGRAASPSRTEAADETRVEQVRGVRRQIAQRLSAAWREIPHITYVEAIDVTELERLRAELNRSADDATRLTLLPFLVRAIVGALSDQPGLNAHYDHDAETLTVVAAVHVGIATQTDDGLRVPVVRHAESHGLRDLADELARVTEAARTGRATRDELSGSTITITSLGAIGGVATTPILNPPEVAIVGVNKIETRPVWRNGAFEPRQVLNLSSSFDHRMVDGWDAATFVQRIKTLLETPALLFLDE